MKLQFLLPLVLAFFTRALGCANGTTANRELRYIWSPRCSRPGSSRAPALVFMVP